MGRLPKSRGWNGSCARSWWHRVRVVRAAAAAVTAAAGVVGTAVLAW
ncbi:hypothetical protein [Streptomyces sp. NPDC002580]